MMKFNRLFPIIFICLSSFLQVRSQTADSIIYEIQDRIESNFISAFQEGNCVKLKKLQLDLIQPKSESFIFKYWQAYALYYESIFHIKTRDIKQSKSKIDEAIHILELIENKNSEVYALMALTRGFSIRFVKGMKAGLISKKVIDSARLAIELDTNNIRGYYVYASNDFYTPSNFGGGKLVESSLLKAISLPPQMLTNPYLPSWGKKLSYELLVSYYIREERWSDAKEYLEKGLNLYPNSYNLNEIANKLDK